MLLDPIRQFRSRQFAARDFHKHGFRFINFGLDLEAVYYEKYFPLPRDQYVCCRH